MTGMTHEADVQGPGVIRTEIGRRTCADALDDQVGTQNRCANYNGEGRACGEPTVFKAGKKSRRIAETLEVRPRNVQLNINQIRRSVRVNLQVTPAGCRC